MKGFLYIKYIIDFIGAVMLFICTFWLMLICTIIIKLDDPKSPVMYNALRIGKGGKPFKMLKFRTMKIEHTGVSLPLESTLTKPGKWIRKFSFDELPQIFNIMKGDMSFIGPRPLVPEYKPWFTKEENERHLVRPGITGLAQINGRANLNWDKRFQLDVQYVRNISFCMDVKILLLTLKKVFCSSNVFIEKDADIKFDFNEYRRLQLEKGQVSHSELAYHKPSEKSQRLSNYNKIQNII